MKYCSSDPEMSYDLLGSGVRMSEMWRVLLALDDSVEVYPAHGAGSACGRAMSAKSGSTIGFERRFNAALQIDTRARDVSFLMEDLPPPPPSFETIVGKNRGLLPLQAA